MYEANGKTPSDGSLVLRFEGMNTIGITFTVSQGYNKKDGQVQGCVGAINSGILHHRLGCYNYSPSWLRLRNAP